MKQDIHPKYYPNAKISCACGYIFASGSTQPEIKVEICAKCHPFFTGQQKLVDTEGLVEKFERKVRTAQQKKLTARKKAPKKTSQEKEEKHPRTLREMLQAQKEKK